MTKRLFRWIWSTKMVEQHILQLQEETEKEPEKAASKKPTAGSANKKSNKKPKAKKPRRWSVLDQWNRLKFWSGAFRLPKFTWAGQIYFSAPPALADFWSNLTLALSKKIKAALFDTQCFQDVTFLIGSLNNDTQNTCKMTPKFISYSTFFEYFFGFWILSKNIQ